MSILKKIKKFFEDNCPCCSKDGAKKEGECCGAHKSEEGKSDACSVDASKKEGE